MLARIVLTGIAVCGIAGLSACNTYPPPPPAPEAPGAPALGPPPPYRIQAGDVLGIDLLLNPDLNEEVVVRPDGHISTTVVKEALAAGRTVPEVEAALTHDYEPVIGNRHLTVALRTFSPVRIYVGGMVNKPGESVTVGTQSLAVAGDPARRRAEDRAREQGVRHPPRARWGPAVLLGSAARRDADARSQGRRAGRALRCGVCVARRRR